MVCDPLIPEVSIYSEMVTVLRTEPGFTDRMTHLIPPNGRPSGYKIFARDHMCADSQNTAHQTGHSPRLATRAGETIALWYQENGHVSLPQLSPGKPNNRGIVSVYGTTTPRTTDSFLSIHNKWNRAGSGGDKRGKLLAQAVFDDGRCYQNNDGAISKHRRKLFPPKRSVLPMGANQWCHINVVLPKEADTGDLYTLYWVWDWPTTAGVDKISFSKPEFYTSCIDIKIHRRGRLTRSLGKIWDALLPGVL